MNRFPLIISFLACGMLCASTRNCTLEVLNQALARLEASDEANSMIPLRPDRAKQLLTAIYQNPALAYAIAESAGFPNNMERLFQVYSRYFDALMPSVDGYLEILKDACEKLPLEGRILDLGGFTGILSAVCLQYPEGNQRKMVVVDRAPGPLALAAKKLSSISNADRFQTHVAKLEDGIDMHGQAYYAPGFTGATLVNVAYLLDDSQLHSVLGHIAAHMDKNGVLFFVDPDKKTFDDPTTKLNHAHNVYESALFNGARLTKESPMVVGAINATLGNRGHHAREQSEIITLFGKYGLHPKEQKKTYYGAANQILFGF